METLLSLLGEMLWKRELPLRYLLFHMAAACGCGQTPGFLSAANICGSCYRLQASRAYGRSEKFVVITLNAVSNPSPEPSI